MKYDVTHKCNCTKQVNLHGTNKERERKLNWLETINCHECQQKINLQPKANTLKVSLKEWSNEYKGYKQVPGTFDMINKTVEIYI